MFSDAIQTNSFLLWTLCRTRLTEIEFIEEFVWCLWKRNDNAREEKEDDDHDENDDDEG